VRQQQIEQRQVPGGGHDGPAVEVANRRVDRGTDFGVLLEQRPDAIDVFRIQRRTEFLNRCHRERRAP
jgi:hypothetical protein